MSRRSCRDCARSRSTGQSSRGKEQRRTRSPSRERRQKESKSDKSDKPAAQTGMEVDDMDDEQEAWQGWTHAQLKAEEQSTELLLRQLKEKGSTRASEEMSQRLASVRRALREKMPDGQKLQHLTASLRKQEKYSEGRRTLIEDFKMQLQQAQQQLEESEQKEEELQKDITAVKAQLAGETQLDTPQLASVTSEQLNLAVAVSCQDLQKQLMSTNKQEDMLTAVRKAMQCFAQRLFPDVALAVEMEAPSSEAATQAVTAAELAQAGAVQQAGPPDRHGACDKAATETPGPYGKASSPAKAGGVTSP